MLQNVGYVVCELLPGRPEILFGAGAERALGGRVQQGCVYICCDSTSGYQLPVLNVNWTDLLEKIRVKWKRPNNNKLSALLEQTKSLYWTISLSHLHFNFNFKKCKFKSQLLLLMQFAGWPTANGANLFGIFRAQRIYLTNNEIRNISL